MGGRKKTPVRNMDEAKALFEKNQGLIGACISRKWGALVVKFGFDAVWQQGSIGLLRACELWNSTSELSTYATAYIDGYLRTLNRYGPAVSRRTVSRETTQHYVLQSLLPAQCYTPDADAMSGERRTRLRKFLRRVLLLVDLRCLVAMMIAVLTCPAFLLYRKTYHQQYNHQQFALQVEMFQCNYL